MSTSPSPSIAISPRVAIEARTRGAIAVAELSDAEDVHVGAGAKRLAAQATTEYHDRFLIELIQNAHDAHDKLEHGGEVEIVFARDEGPYGALYVANRGKPFSHSNFKMICEPGLTDKPPGEAIGNKGIGFQSVLQVCGRPEIYSAAEDSSASAAAFGGFCFSFATDEELLELVEGDRARLEIVRRETATFHLPVPLDEQPARVKAYARRGFASVVRLPLNRAGAVGDVERQLAALREGAAPLLLFLDRLAHLVIEVAPKSESEPRLDLFRYPDPLDWPEARGLDISLVDLKDHGRYLCASLTIDAAIVEAVIAEAVSARELEETWLDWRDDAVVSAAVRLDTTPDTTRLYTYLPMEVDAPFAGHLSAPFYAKLDRRDLNRELSLNKLFLDAGARACVLAAEAIAARNDRHLAGSAVDFIAWDSAESSRLKDAVDEGRELTQAVVLPVIGPDGPDWGSLSSTYVWRDDGLRTLATEAVAQSADISLLDLALGTNRVARVEHLHAALLRRSMAPTSTEIADWVERVAQERGGAKGRLLWWNHFYDDVARVLEHDGGELAGRRILLDEDRVLRATVGSEPKESNKEPTVFFQPVRQRAEGVVDIDAADDVHIPKTLRRRVVFLNSGLEWFERVGNTRRRSRARSYLETNDLVRPYAARSLLEHLRDLLRESRSKEVSRDALRLAFRLQRTRDYDQRPALRDLRLRVPCQGGWLAASQAHFSSSWPGTMGKTLERVIDLAKGVSNELGGVERTLLLPPDEWGFAVEPDAWVTFLRQAGVRDGLWPTASKPARAEARGSEFTAARIGRQLGLKGRQLASWTEAVAESGSAPHVDNGTYRNRTPVYVLPGQADYESLPERARHEYASLIAGGCGLWSDEQLVMRIQRTDVTSRNFDPFSWPTPVSAFLEQEAWMPMRVPHTQDEVTFVRLGDAWHFSDRASGADDYAHPDYAPLLPLRLRRALDERPKSLARLRTHGLRVWNDPSDAADLVKLLGRLVAAEDSVVDQYPNNVRRAYEQAWAYALDQGKGDDATRATHLVVTRAGQLDAFAMAPDADEALYIYDGGSRLTDSLLQLSSRPLLDVGERRGRELWQLLRDRLGPLALRTSEERVLVLDGDDAIIPDDSRRLLVADDLEWIDGFVLAVVELRRGAFRRLTGLGRERIIETVRSTRVHFAAKIALRIGSEILEPPQGMRDAVPLHDPANPLLVIRGPGPSITWDRLESVCPALADLIGYAELAPTMQLAVTRLMGDRRGMAVSVPSIAEMADAIGQPETRVREVITSLKGSGLALVDALAPALVALIGLEPFLEVAGEARSMEDEEDVVSLLSGLELPIGAGELRSLARGAAGPDDLRRALDLPLGLFNSALRALGRAPIHYVAEHDHVFAAFVAAKRDELLLEVRRAYVAVFRSEGDLSAYVQARDSLGLLGADPSWLDEHELPPEDLMLDRLWSWAASAVGDLAPAPDELEALDLVRRENRAHVRECVETAQRAVLAWCPLHTTAVPDLWNRSDVEMAIWDALLSEGETDFEPLSESRVLKWLEGRDHWPVAMPRTLDLVELHLTDEDLERAQTNEQRDRAHREFVKRSVELAGTRYSAAPENFAALAEAARGTISDSLLRTKSGFSGLTPPDAKRSRGERSGGTKKAGKRGPTEAQKEAIGLVGEIVALEWLKRRYPGASDDCWRSGYRDYVLGGSAGNDNLGFDFEVPVGRTTYMFEVKATVGEDEKIELTENEVDTARTHARSDRYRVLYVPSALDPTRRALYVLPNPFSERGRDLFQLEGSGLRYRFRLDGP